MFCLQAGILILTIILRDDFLSQLRHNLANCLTSIKGLTCLTEAQHLMLFINVSGALHIPAVITSSIYKHNFNHSCQYPQIGAQNLKRATHFRIVNANKMPGFGEKRMPCPYFLDRLPGWAPSNQHLRPEFLYFPSPEEHKEPFGDSAHKNNSLSFPALCFHLFIFSVWITFLRGNTVFLSEQLYIWLLKGSLIMKNPIWN